MLYLPEAATSISLLRSRWLWMNVYCSVEVFVLDSSTADFSSAEPLCRR
jgi:hypothetical protein